MQVSFKLRLTGFYPLQLNKGTQDIKRIKDFFIFYLFRIPYLDQSGVIMPTRYKSYYLFGTSVLEKWDSVSQQHRNDGYNVFTNTSFFE
jgi:hypothetical protein